MAARGVPAAALDARSAEVESICRSSALHGSESLCRLLRYLSNRAIQEPGAAVREHEIAAEVFGRSDFDPRIDSTVRVNVARLRAKLIEFYSGPGAEHSIIAELPKGSYSVVFQTRPPDGPAPVVEVSVLESPASAPEGASPIQPEPMPVPQLNRVLAIGLVSMTAIASMLAATLLLDHGGRSEKAAAASIPDSPSLRRFWSLVLNGPGEPWVVFSNAAFVGRPATGMRYLVPSRDSGLNVLDFYTGIGEVLGVHALDRTFALLNRPIRVKRGGLLSLDDVENNDVVYVGSPLENLTLRDVPGMRDFEFKLIEEGPQQAEGALVNLSPRDGEPAVFTSSSLPLTRDYAVVALVPGLNPSHWALILAGISTMGTQGAVEYVCRDDTARELVDRLGPSPGSRPLFEAVLEIQIKGGVPVHSRLAAFHRHRN
jgi:hypothetical protein